MISNKVIEILTKELKAKPAEITLQKRLVEDLGADSLRKVECIMKLEEVFSVVITDDEARLLITVEDIVSHIKYKVDPKNLA